ncbi:MAG: 60 kDa inner rane insertion protein [Hyphomicrobiales bacterium]|nr:60 kDa inner rane insertion protein [Hyphomicrobiales bacterium]
MSAEQKNLFVAIGLSLMVLIGWNYFYGVPTVDKSRQVNQQIQARQDSGVPPNAVTPASPAANPENPGLTPPGTVQGQAEPVQVARSREQALALSPRITIDTPALTGSIALRGARIDDVSLKNYRETTDPKSPLIVLLSPTGAPEPYYAEMGFVGAPGSTTPLPNAETLWTAQSQTLGVGKPVDLTWDNGKGLIFHRTISLDDHYMFTVKDSVENKGGEPVTMFPYALVSRHGKPVTSGYAVLHEGMVGIVGDSRVVEITYDGIEKETKATKLMEGTSGWLGFTDKYWATAIVPEQDAPFKARFSAAGAPGAQRIYQTDLLEDAHVIQPNSTADVTTTRVFAGAKEVQTIDAYQATLGIKNFDLMIDWGWFYFITKPLFRLIDTIYKFVGNFGLAILIVTVLVKGVFFPLANRSYLSMAKMKAAQPEMTLIRERYADDKQKQQQELMELYRREKINPVAGCLPVVVQIPVFFALYKVIFITLEMRHAPFFGWIHDLSAPDPTNLFNLFGLLPFDPTHLPVIGHFLAIGVWPLIMGFSMFIQMKMNPEPSDPVQKQMFTWMPVLFTFMLGTFPAGLVIYWTWNNTLSVAQQYLIMRRSGVKVELWDNLTGLFGRKTAKS